MANIRKKTVNYRILKNTLRDLQKLCTKFSLNMFINANSTAKINKSDGVIFSFVMIFQELLDILENCSFIFVRFEKGYL